MRALIVVSLVGCGRIDFDRATNRDANGVTADACTLSAWTAPRRIVELATAVEDWGGQLSLDGLELYFDSDRSGIDLVYVATRPDRSTSFGVPAELLPGVDSLQASNPATTTDDLELMFDSDRALEFCLWDATRATTGDVWTGVTQQSLTCPGTTRSTGGTFSSDGLTLYYSTFTGSGPEGTLMIATRADRSSTFGAGVAIAELASGAMKGFPSLSADNLTIYFESRTPLDVYTATRTAIGQPFDGPVRRGRFDLG